MNDFEQLLAKLQEKRTTTTLTFEEACKKFADALQTIAKSMVEDVPESCRLGEISGKLHGEPISQGYYAEVGDNKFVLFKINGGWKLDAAPDDRSQDPFDVSDDLAKSMLNIIELIKKRNTPKPSKFREFVQKFVNDDPDDPISQICKRFVSQPASKSEEEMVQRVLNGPHKAIKFKTAVYVQQGDTVFSIVCQPDGVYVVDTGEKTIELRDDEILSETFKKF